MHSTSVLSFFVISLAALFCVQSAQAQLEGPKITHKVYFDIKRGDEDLGRSECYLTCECIKALMIIH